MNTYIIYGLLHSREFSLSLFATSPCEAREHALRAYPQFRVSDIVMEPAYRSGDYL